MLSKPGRKTSGGCVLRLREETPHAPGARNSSLTLPPGSALNEGSQATESCSRELVLPLDNLEHNPKVTIDHLVGPASRRALLAREPDHENGSL